MHLAEKYTREEEKTISYLKARCPLWRQQHLHKKQSWQWPPDLIKAYMTQTFAPKPPSLWILRAERENSMLFLVLLILAACLVPLLAYATRWRKMHKQKNPHRKTHTHTTYIYICRFKHTDSSTVSMPHIPSTELCTLSTVVLSKHFKLLEKYYTGLLGLGCTHMETDIRVRYTSSQIQ